MAKYPEVPKTKSGYTENWITAYLKDKATARQINKYIKAIDGKDKKEKKSIFLDMFINKPEKKTKVSFEDGLKAVAKEKRAEEKANKAKKEV